MTTKPKHKPTPRRHRAAARRELREREAQELAWLARLELESRNV
jgi:hypothetical protein